MTRFVRLASIAVMCALLTATGELVLRLGVQHFVLHRYIYASRDIVWMTPFANLLLFAAVGVVLGMLSLIWPRAASLRTSLTVLATIGVIGILTLQPWMAWWAMLPLALGIGAQTGRLAQAHERMAWRLIRGVSGGLFVVLGAATAVVLLGDSHRERDALAMLPSPPAAAPNVLVIVWDAVRAENLSLLGYDRPTTPWLQTFATRGVSFEHAIAPAPYTLTTHASLFTGRWPHQLKASWEQPLDEAVPTLADVLARRGYRTGIFSANHLFVTWEHGLLRGFAHWNDYSRSAEEVARSSALVKRLASFDWIRSGIGRYDVLGRRTGDDIGNSFLSWMHRDTSRPFFAFLNLYDAHSPYLPPHPFDSNLALPGTTASDLRIARRRAIDDPVDFTPIEMARYRASYDGAIASTDAHTGAIMDSLERSGILKNTLVIILSDHGEAFGEHRTIGHGHDLYSDVTHVPLVAVLPGHIPAGVRVPGVVSVRDIPATIMDVAGFAGTTPALPGNTLSRFWTTGQPPKSDTVLTEVDRLRAGERPWYPVRRGPVRSVIAWPYQLILSADSTELYDLSSDRHERSDLASRPALRAKRDSLIALLREKRGDAVRSKR